LAGALHEQERRRGGELSHLVKDAPYVAIGINDTITGIHEPNESIATSRIDVSIKQFVTFLGAATTFDGGNPSAQQVETSRAALSSSSDSRATLSLG
jgi:hypothetical protein